MARYFLSFSYSRTRSHAFLLFLRFLLAQLVLSSRANFLLARILVLLLPSAQEHPDQEEASATSQRPTIKGHGLLRCLVMWVYRWRANTRFVVRKYIHSMISKQHGSARLYLIVPAANNIPLSEISAGLMIMWNRLFVFMHSSWYKRARSHARTGEGSESSAEIACTSGVILTSSLRCKLEGYSNGYWLIALITWTAVASRRRFPQHSVDILPFLFCTLLPRLVLLASQAATGEHRDKNSMQLCAKLRGTPGVNRVVVLSRCVHVDEALRHRSLN